MGRAGFFCLAVEPAVDGAFEFLDLMILSDADNHKRQERNDRNHEICAARFEPPAL